MKWSQFFAMAVIISCSTGHIPTGVIYTVFSVFFAYKEIKDDELDDEDME